MSGSLILTILRALILSHLTFFGTPNTKLVSLQVDSQQDCFIAELHHTNLFLLTFLYLNLVTCATSEFQ